MNQRIKAGLVIIGLTLLFLYFFPGTKERRVSGSAMGTSYSVKWLEEGDLEYSELESKLKAEIEKIDGLMSTYKPESELSRFNELRHNDWFSVSNETQQVISLAKEVAELTDGAFDPTVLPLVELWGFGSQGMVSTQPKEEQVKEALIRTGFNGVENRENPPALRKINRELVLDLSAIAKGYGSDRAAEVLLQSGIRNFMVEIGGEVRASGLNRSGDPWRIAVEQAVEDSDKLDIIVPIKDRSIATSGTYRNYFNSDGRRFSHLINPQDGLPVKHNTVSVTVLDKSCARADAFATALLVLGAEKGMQLTEKLGLSARFVSVGEEGELKTVSSKSFDKALEG